MKDLLGRTYGLGDMVAWGGARHSLSYTAVGEIVKIGKGTLSVRKIKDSTTWYDTKAVVVLKRPEKAVIICCGSK